MKNQGYNIETINLDGTYSYKIKTIGGQHLSGMKGVFNTEEEALLAGEKFVDEHVRNIKEQEIFNKLKELTSSTRKPIYTPNEFKNYMNRESSSSWNNHFAFNGCTVATCSHSPSHNGTKLVIFYYFIIN